ncbi:extracellular solute-binding protein [Halalkalirubrum salinum]|uniref:extracellular solute-binding protein n=1 Tax=Halalkalirubrum salinum TaxID=2563889 RepID=UPI0010FAE612|nr:extracellular solute-binding protein [Halalkalirubrum salinum]
MTWKRRKLLTTLGGTGAVALAGCASVEEDGNGGNGGNGNGGNGNGGNGDDGNGNGDETVAGEAEIWYDLSESELEIMEGSIEEYNASTDFEIEGVDVAEMQDRLTSAIPTGEGPDVFIWAHDLAGDFSDSQFLSAQTGNFDLDVFTPAAQDAVEFEGEVYGLPFGAETVALLYNREIVDEPPETIEEMQSIMDEYHDPANNQYGLSYPIDAYFVSGYAHALGGFYYQTDGHELGLTNQETVDGLNIVIEELYPYSPDDPEYDPQMAVFTEGNAPFAINGPWELGNFDFDTGVTKLPAPDGGTASPYTGVQMFYFADGVEDEDSTAEAARDFTEWYTTNTDVSRELAEQQGLIPVLDELAGTDDLSDAVQGFTASLADGTPMPAHPRMNDVWGPVEDAVGNTLSGEMSLEDALADAEERVRDNWE